MQYIQKQRHEVIHFVDFQNRAASVADPYCLGLLELHNRQRKSYMYKIAGKARLQKQAQSLSILNRFAFTGASGQAQANFTLLVNGKVCRADSVDAQFLSHYSMDIFDRNCEHIKVA